jgi:two-component system C4-dicarboxylate transport sensor histidine kinase DctB
MVAQSGQSRIVLDVGQDDSYFDNPYLTATRSEIALPLQVHEQLIGVLDVQSEDANAFNEADKVVLQTMADQLAIGIENARQYEELRRTRGLVGSRTALAWMGMASSAWRHTIDKHAISIKEQVDLLAHDLRSLLLSDKQPRLEERLSMIRRLAQQIGEKQITPPLSAEEGVISLPINGLIRERMKQLKENEPYRSVEFRLNLTLPNAITVRASSEWLRRALDILIDNGVDAMLDAPQRVMTIETVQRQNDILIRISDTGKGIPEEMQPQLFRNPVEKTKGSKGLGMGLLMAQAIIQTYGGEIAIESTGKTGTTMFICLPSEA